MIAEFKLFESEKKAAEKFLIEHRHPDVNKGAIGGHISYIFTPTSIGDAVSIRCNICNKEENITDYGTW